LVEDEVKTAQMLSEGLKSEGIDVHCVVDGKSALAAIKEDSYDLVVLDLKLPGMSGDQVLEGIREVDPFIDVVVYTNYQDPPVMKKLINLGVDKYISKGSEADLWDTIDKIKMMLEPFSEQERDRLLDQVPDATFKDL
jgi:DNA-binding response OmpR family regulator